MGLTRRTLLAGSLAIPAFGRVTAPLAQDTGPTIKEVANANGFRFGSAAGPWTFQPAMERLLQHECDLITPENAMKMDHVYEELGPANFADADQIVRWAHSFDASVRAHALIFAPEAIPRWLNDLADTDRLEALQQVLAYVRQVARRYRNQVASIDVVNEALNKDANHQGLLKNNWLYRDDSFQLIRDAYAIAREEQPGAELVYNDWVLPYDNPALDGQREDMLLFLETCRENDIQIDTVGIQSHLRHWQGRTFISANWTDFLHEIEGMGYKIAITELSASDDWLSGVPERSCRNLTACERQVEEYAQDEPIDPYTAGERIRVRDQEAGRAVAEYLAATLQATSIRDIVCWGLSDAHWYLNHRDRFYRDGCITEEGAAQPCIRALPYDELFEMKPMARAIMAAMEQAPPRS